MYELVKADRTVVDTAEATCLAEAQDVFRVRRWCDDPRGLYVREQNGEVMVQFDF